MSNDTVSGASSAGGSTGTVRGTVAVTAAESGRSSPVQIAPTAAQSVVAGSVTVTSPTPASGSSLMVQTRLDGDDLRPAAATRPPLTAKTLSTSSL